MTGHDTAIQSVRKRFTPAQVTTPVPLHYDQSPSLLRVILGAISDSWLKTRNGISLFKQFTMAFTMALFPMAISQPATIAQIGSCTNAAHFLK